MATHYGLDGPEIESPWGARISASVQTVPGAHPASYPMGTVFIVMAGYRVNFTFALFHVLSNSLFNDRFNIRCYVV